MLGQEAWGPYGTHMVRNLNECIHVDQAFSTSWITYGIYFIIRENSGPLPTAKQKYMVSSTSRPRKLDSRKKHDVYRRPVPEISSFEIFKMAEYMTSLQGTDPLSARSTRDSTQENNVFWKCGRSTDRQTDRQTDRTTNPQTDRSTDNKSCLKLFYYYYQPTLQSATDTWTPCLHAARVWNSLPSSLRWVQSLTTFRHCLKAELFDSSFTWLSYCTINMRVLCL